MAKVPFTHLHLHTEYSLLDGAIQASALFERVKALGQESVAMTDHGMLHGTVDFYTKARESGVKPIIGCEAYIATGSRFDKEKTEKLEDPTRGQDAYRHQLLIAMNNTGYKNLMRLITIASLEGFYHKPRIDMEVLTQFNEGLITTSGCLSSMVCRKLLAGKRDEAWQLVEQHARIFDGRYYLELQRHGIEDQDTVNAELLKMAEDLKLPLLATNDAHYLKHDDHECHDALLCIGTGAKRSEEKRFRFDGQGFYVKSGAEMLEVFGDCPEAVRNTMEIAERCDVEIEMDKIHMPEFQVPAGTKRENVLEENAWRGLREKLGMEPDAPFENGRSEYAARMRYELDIIKNKGFAGYFLIVADFIAYAKRSEIPVGPGRGSSAGSLAAYGLGITNVDPLVHDILFERFLTPERNEMPDIDVDICKRGREQVRNYLIEHYDDPEQGEMERRVAQIVSFGTMKARGVVRDVGRVLELPQSEINQFAKLVPADDLKMTLEKARQRSSELRAQLASNPQWKEVFELAKGIEGLSRHSTKHAAGLVIGARPLVELVPLARDKKSGEVMTQFPMEDVGKLGLVKFDLLGLSTLTVLADAERLIREQGDEDFRAETVPLDDAKTYELISAGAGVGIFQMESSGMRDLAKRLRPRRFEDLALLIALFRPGPMGSGMHHMCVDRRAGREPVSYPLPQLEPLLKNTYGLLLYQDQVLQIVTGLAGYSWLQADELRKAMGKKKVTVLEQQRPRFIEGCAKNGIAKKTANDLYDQMVEFGEYGFAKAHAVAYAFLVYQTAYLKVHYAREYFAALLSNEAEEKRGRLGFYIGHARERGIEVLPPDVNESGKMFQPVPSGLRFGFRGMKGVGDGAIDAIVEARASGGPFRSVFDFTRRVDLRRVNRRVLESLIKGGAFDSLHEDRAVLFEARELAMNFGADEQRDRASGQARLFGDTEEAVPRDIALPEAAPWSEHERLAREKEVLGFYITGHPLSEHRGALRRLANLRGGEVSAGDDTDTGSEDSADASERAVRVGGLITKIREQRTKRGQTMAFATLEDLDGSFELVIFAKNWERMRPLLQRALESSNTALGEANAETRVLPVLASGKLESEKEAKILVDEVHALEDAEDYLAAELHIRLLAEEADAARLVKLRELLATHTGKCAVRLFLTIPGESETLMEFPNLRGVDPSEKLRREIDTLFGHPVAEVTL